MRLETLGFTHVFEYTAGKRDWTARGLPREGTLVDKGQVQHAMDEAVTTCTLADSLDDVKQKATSDKRGCIVVSDERIVLGRIRAQALYDESADSVAKLMELGPSTYRPDVPLEEIVTKMKKQRLDDVIVTDLTGRLMGILELSAADLWLARKE